MMTLVTGPSIKAGGFSQYQAHLSNRSLIINTEAGYISKSGSFISTASHQSLRPMMSNAAFMRRGFTLIEIMVVLLIIGVILSIAIPALNISSDEDRLNKEALRLLALMDLASQESILNAKITGIRTEQQGYLFLSLNQNDEKWITLEDKVLSRHTLPEDIELELLLEGYNTPEYADTEEQQTVPQIMIMPSGEFTPFTLRFKSRNTETVFSLNGHANGKLEIIRHGANQ